MTLFLIFIYVFVGILTFAGCYAYNKKVDKKGNLPYAVWFAILWPPILLFGLIFGITFCLMSIYAVLKEYNK